VSGLSLNIQCYPYQLNTIARFGMNTRCTDRPYCDRNHTLESCINFAKLHPLKWSSGTVSRERSGVDGCLTETVDLEL